MCTVDLPKVKALDLRLSLNHGNGGPQIRSLAVSKDVEFPDTPALWPDKEVTELVNAFRNTFPKQTRLAAQVVTTIVVVIQKEDFQIAFKEIILCSRKYARMGLPVLFEKSKV